MNTETGELIDQRYRVVKCVGRGCMADVFEAVDEQTNRAVAVKVLRDQLSQADNAVERLKREARVQQMIQHRNVAAVLGGGVTSSGHAYIVVELLAGLSLRNVIRTKGAQPYPRAASYIWQALQGLAAAHTLGVIHRDLKPANLMLEASPGPVERVVVIDFGFASLEGASRLTKAGHVVGSLAYLAPERFAGDRGSIQSDLYALGVILYELLTGRRPFVAENELDLVKMQMEDTPPPFSDVAPTAKIPVCLEEVVMQALAKKPEERPPHAGAMARLIEAAAAAQ